ncbi:hypothetical protein Cgig2_013636 [Carnegiea gigantea]|uniref:Reverse transcriptase zinc-binding domain-containing protein n=1 Tax=Carnegiea gigantea TaxID=171969 RepID=A0A9Q1KCT6_9CARY|nr:hypothetical protein Cgig2_013636 [Carnegiea gigantea]
MEGFQLTEEEATVVEYVEETPKERLDQVSLCLMGKLFIDTFFNVGALKTMLKNIWKPAKGLVIKEFFSAVDMEFALNEGPSAFDGCTRLLKRVTGMEQPSEIMFDTVRFWVKAYDVPGLKQTSSFAKFLGNNIGQFVGCDEASLVGVDLWVNLQVDVDIRRPLRRGIWVKSEGKAIWITFKFVKLADFSYACGWLGHTYKGCVLFDAGVPESELQYGPQLRASPLKSKRCNAGVELLLLAFRKGQDSVGARARLDFDIARHKLEAGGARAKGGSNSEHMHVDGEAVEGRAGGLAWRKSIKVNLLSYSFNHIDVELEDFGARDKWRLIGKLRTYELLKQLKNESPLLWLIGGDLNELLYNYEKTGRGLKSQNVLQTRDGDESVEERLDRFCASIEWSLVFPNAKVVHLNAKLSDHLPILLKLHDIRRLVTRKGKHFKFENMWAMEEGCRRVVEEAWTAGSEIGNGEELQSKLQAYRVALSQWHSETFGDIKAKIRNLSSQLEGVRDIQLRDKILDDIRQLRHKEELFWAQRAEADFLKYGDSNTRWFHARANMRRAANSIRSLEREDGSVAPSYADQPVSGLICKEAGTWREELLRRVLPIDADLVLQIPLCSSWSSDKLIWHFAANGLFSVRSAYHLARSLKLSSMASSSFHGTKDFWRLVWGLNVPPWIKLFAWRVGVSALPTRAHLSRRLPNFSTACGVCEALEESDLHSLLHCPLAQEIWSGSDFDAKLWNGDFSSVMDCLLLARDSLVTEELGEFVAVL